MSPYPTIYAYFNFSDIISTIWVAVDSSYPPNLSRKRRTQQAPRPLLELVRCACTEYIVFFEVSLPQRHSEGRSARKSACVGCVPRINLGTCGISVPVCVLCVALWDRSRCRCGYPPSSMTRISPCAAEHLDDLSAAIVSVFQ